MIDRAFPLKGRVRIWNEVGDVYESSNLVVYGGADVIARLLAGYDAYKISHICFAFQNTAGSPPVVTPARTDTAASAFHGLVAPSDFLRVPVLSPAQIASGGINYAGNQATFIAIANATVGVNGVPFGSANNSKVFALGIVAAPTGAYAGDVLYAYFGLTTPIAAAGTGQVSATWTLEAT